VLAQDCFCPIFGGGADEIADREVDQVSGEGDLGLAFRVEGLVSDVLPKLPRRARLLTYVDLLGLDRFVGGRGVCDRELRR
jgi:hypothetical protein